MRADLGLDQPVIVQYGKFVADAAARRPRHVRCAPAPVVDLIKATRCRSPLWLSLCALVIAVRRRAVAGSVAAVYRGRWPEWVANAFTLAGLSVPSFWLGILAILYLAVGLRLVPGIGLRAGPGGAARGLYYLALPSLVLGTGARRGGDAADPGVDDRVAATDYVRTARAKGLPRARVLHAVRACATR